MTDETPGLPPQAPPPAAPAQPPVAPAPPPVAPAPQPAAPAPQPAAPQYGYQPGTGRPGPMPGVYFANHLPRFVAYLIDGFVLGVVVWVLVFAIGLIGAALAQASDALGALVLVGGYLALLVLGLAWFPYWWSKSGQTPGLKVMHLKVVRAVDGQPLSFGGGILRLIGYWISAAVFYIGFIWILVDTKRQGWHDKIAGTYVIEVP